MRTVFSKLNFHDKLIAFPLWTNHQPDNAIFHNNNEKIYNRKTQLNQFGLNRAVENVKRGSILVFPVKSDPPTPAVVIFLGGAFVKITIDEEGIDIAQRLNMYGITAFVIKYRTVPAYEWDGWNHRDSNPMYDAFYTDARQAIRVIRSKTNEFNIDPNKLGVLGFSADGRLAANLLVDQSGNNSPNWGTVDSASFKINFGGLIYPVVTDTLIRQISCYTPPTFIVNCRDDKSAPAIDAGNFHEALTNNGIESEAYIFETGGHGFGLGDDGGIVAQWPALFTDWLKKISVIRRDK